MQFPHIHLNGSSPEGLQNPIREAYVALGKAIEKMSAVTPHGRDYYTISGSAINVAYAEHRERVEKLVSVQSDLLAIFQDIDRQVKERDKFRYAGKGWTVVEYPDNNDGRGVVVYRGATEDDCAKWLANHPNQTKVLAGEFSLNPPGEE